MPDSIYNPRTGQRMVFVTETPELLEIETFNAYRVQHDNRCCRAHTVSRPMRTSHARRPAQ